MVEFAEKQIEQVKVATVEEQIDEAQHGCRTHHTACQTAEPNHRLDDTHGEQIKTWEGRDHRVPLCKMINTILDIWNIFEVCCKVIERVDASDKKKTRADASRKAAVIYEIIY